MSYPGRHKEDGRIKTGDREEETPEDEGGGEQTAMSRIDTDNA